MTNVDINDFNEEKTCVYKDETYSVRDNGAVLRHSKENGKNRKNDNIWTFGRVVKQTDENKFKLFLPEKKKNA